MKQQTIKRLRARDWLVENGYPEIVVLIDDFIQHNKDIGSGERRNYWDLLAGRKDGERITRNGFVFPILESVRKSRKPDFPKSKHAIRKNKIEIIPKPMKQGRWLNIDK